MEQAPGLPQRNRGLDLLAAHIAGLDPEAPRARDRLEAELGGELARMLVTALSRRNVPVPLARAQLAAVAA